MLNEHEPRFLTNVDKSGPTFGSVHACWVWAGGTRKGAGHAASRSKPYGRFWVGKRCYAAHRFAYMLWCGDPTGHVVCHRCDNTLCVNPSHLFLGSHAENMADMVAKGRSTPGERNPAAKLTAEAVESIRQAIAGGASRRSLARHHGVSQRTIQRIDQGLRWQPAAAARAIEQGGV